MEGRRPPARRALLVFSVAGNLGLLCYFKYVNFFLESIRDGLNASGAGVDGAATPCPRFA